MIAEPRCVTGARGARVGSRQLAAAAMSYFLELFFNVDNGYLEGLVRGLKAGVLSQADYLNLVQCETLEGELQGRQGGWMDAWAQPGLRVPRPECLGVRSGG